MDREIPVSKNRHFIIDLLRRAQKFHCPVTTSWQMDVTSLNEARIGERIDGRPLGMTALLVKATALTLKAHPRLNHHLFTGLLRRREVAFGTVDCTLIVMRRGRGGERILLPLLLREADKMSVQEIQKIIDHHRSARLEDLPQFRAIARLRSLPRVMLSWFSYKSRSDPAFYRRYFGTYGMSEMAVADFGPRGGNVVANTASAFVIGPLFAMEQPGPQGRRIRMMQGISLVSDHYIIDGIDILAGMRTLERLLADPARLGLGDPRHGG